MIAASAIFSASRIRVTQLDFFFLYIKKSCELQWSLVKELREINLTYLI